MAAHPSFPKVSEQHVERMGSMMLSVLSGMTEAMEQALALHDTGLRFNQFKVLLRLRHNGPMMAGDLACAIHHDPGALTRLIDQLEQKGLVQRLPHETDRRALRLALTPEGERMGVLLHKLRMGVMERMLQHLDEGEREQFMDYLQRMLAGLNVEDRP